MLHFGNQRIGRSDRICEKLIFCYLRKIMFYYILAILNGQVADSISKLS